MDFAICTGFSNNEKSIFGATPLGRSFWSIQWQFFIKKTAILINENLFLLAPPG